ncbi:aldehyde dehydrogenase [Colletotrichum tabaci]|uniref:Aldehyde dehydrogenase n=1 Tax=Colletotrichum tabaci TaxID=1209068 RepID=A0AAV9SXM6_9PEZI
MSALPSRPVASDRGDPTSLPNAAENFCHSRQSPLHHPLGLFIDNDFVPSSNRQTLTTTNPSTEDDIFSVYAATPDDVDTAVAAAALRFRAEEEALAMANDSPYGLGAAVFIRDLAMAHANDSDVQVPFGGVKQSGIGRELGEAGLLGYCIMKAVHVNLTSE